MSETGGSPRAPFECVCGFTAGTSFAWEKHLALRNTPYSSVKHSRVIRSVGDSVGRHKPSYDETPRGSAWRSDHRDADVESSVYDGSKSSIPYPTPKALFRDRSSYPSPDAKPLPLPTSYDRSPSPTSPLSASRSVVNGMRLQEAAKRGDMDRVARLAVEILRLAQQGDPEGVLDVISDNSSSPASSRDFAQTQQQQQQQQQEVKFSANITVVHQNPGGISVEQVPTGLKNAYMQDQIGRKDALRLLAMTEPLLDSANSNIIGPAQFGVDIGVLKRNIIAVCQHATRITANESRILEVKSPVYVLGDIHGNISDLQFFRKTLWSTGPEVTAGDFLFLGDFVDRGRNSIPVIAYIMSMKILNPGKWHMIRGNHETREVNGNIEHYQDGSFLLQCLSIFGESDGYAVWEAVNNFFDTLALAATIDDKIFCVHGGIPRELCKRGSSLDLIRNVPCPLRSVQADETVYDMLWSDPTSPEQENSPELDSNGFGVSARGCTCFGERSIDLFLDIHGFKHVFRGHEAQQSGVGVSKSARLTTIFSTSQDHFAGNIVATCGCVLVDHSTIHPIVRALPAAPHVGLSPTYAGQSVEAQEVHVTHVNDHSGSSSDFGMLSPYSRSEDDRRDLDYYSSKDTDERHKASLPMRPRRAWEADSGMSGGVSRGGPLVSRLGT